MGVILVFTRFGFLFFLGWLVLGWFGWLTFLVTFGIFSWGGTGFLYLRAVNAFFRGRLVSLLGGSGCILRGNFCFSSIFCFSRGSLKLLISSFSPIFTSGHSAPIFPRHFSLFGGSLFEGSLRTSGGILGRIFGGVFLGSGIFDSGSPPFAEFYDCFPH